MSGTLRTNCSLLEGWRWVRLGDICQIIIGKTPNRKDPNAWGGSHAWAKISDMDSDIVTQTAEALSDKGSAACSGRLLNKGTLLYSFKLTIGKTAFAGVDLFTNEAIAGLSPKCPEDVSMPFLRYALSIADTSQFTGNAVKGKTLNKRSLALLPIPLPPPNEQQSVVARLNERMAAAERIQRAADQTTLAARVLPSSVLRQMFPLPGENLPPSWRWSRLNEVTEFLDYRRQPINEPERVRRREGKPIKNLYPYYGANGQVDWIDGYLFDEPAVLLAEDGGFFGSYSQTHRI